MKDAEKRISALVTSEIPAKWVFTGDSITHGALHTFGYRDYTEHFSERIRFEMGRHRDCVIKTGMSGRRVSEIADDLEWNVLQYSPQVVSLHLGMNDCTEGPSGVVRFKENFHRLLIRIKSVIDAVIILHCPNPIFDSAERKNDDLKLYAEAIRGIAVDHGAILVDHARDWLEAEERQFLRFRLSDDIHPNEYGHRAMAHALFRALNIYDESSFTCRLLVP